MINKAFANPIRLIVLAAIVLLSTISLGCNQNRYQPADWAARKAALSTLPANQSSGTTLPRGGTTLPRGTTLPYSGSTLPGNGTTLPGGMPSGTTMPR